MAKKTSVGEWKRVPATVQQGLLDDLKSFGIKSPTKVLWTLMISKKPQVYFTIAKTRRKKEPYDAIMFVGSGKHKGKYVIERSPTIQAAKRAGTNTAKHFEKEKSMKRRKNNPRKSTKDLTGLILAGAVGFVIGQMIKDPSGVGNSMRNIQMKQGGF